jgi:hypothetical protein
MNSVDVLKRPLPKALTVLTSSFSALLYQNIKRPSLLCVRVAID